MALVRNATNHGLPLTRGYLAAGEERNIDVDGAWEQQLLGDGSLAMVDENQAPPPTVARYDPVENKRGSGELYARQGDSRTLLDIGGGIPEGGEEGDYLAPEGWLPLPVESVDAAIGDTPLTAPSGDLSARIAITTETPRYFSFPSTVRLADGRLLVIFRRATGHTNAKGTLYKSYSSDEGQTWTTPAEFFADATLDARDPNISLMPDGRLCVLFSLSVANPTARFLNNIRVMFDQDGTGTTWDAPITLPDPYTEWGGVGGPVVVAANGDWIAPIFGKNTGSTDNICGLLRSTDQGATWGNYVQVFASAGNQPGEPVMALMPDDTLLCAIRVLPGKTMVRRRSSDHGATWSTAGTTGAANNVVKLLLLASGRLLLFTRHNTTGEPILYQSLDYGTTLVSTAQRVIETGPTTYTENMGPVELEPGLIGYASGLEFSASTSDSQIYFKYLRETPGATPDGTLVGLKLGADADGSAAGRPFRTNALAVAKTANYNAVAGDGPILMDATAAARTVNLPHPATCKGYEFIVIKSDASANAVTFGNHSTGKPDGAGTPTFTPSGVSLAAQGDRARWVNDGVNWYRAG